MKKLKEHFLNILIITYYLLVEVVKEFILSTYIIVIKLLSIALLIYLLSQCVSYEQLSYLKHITYFDWVILLSIYNLFFYKLASSENDYTKTSNEDESPLNDSNLEDMVQQNNKYVDVEIKKDLINGSTRE